MMNCDFDVGTEKCNITGLRKCNEKNTDDVGYVNVQKSAFIIGTSWWISAVNYLHECALHVMCKWNWK